MHIRLYSDGLVHVDVRRGSYTDEPTKLLCPINPIGQRYQECSDATGVTCPECLSALGDPARAVTRVRIDENTWGQEGPVPVKLSDENVPLAVGETAVAYQPRGHAHAEAQVVSISDNVAHLSVAWDETTRE